MHTPRVVIWTTSDSASNTSETLIGSQHVAKGVRAGLVWTETAVAFPERDVPGMSGHARAGDQE